MIFSELEYFVTASFSLLGVTCAPSAVTSFMRELTAYAANYPSGGYKVFFWTYDKGLGQCGTQEFEQLPNTNDPLNVLENLEDNPEDKALYVLYDFQQFLTGQKADPLVISRLFNLVHKLKTTNQTIILLEEDFSLPQFEGLIHILEYGLPSQTVIKSFLKQLVNRLPDKTTKPHVGDKLIRSCQGLTIAEINDAVRFSLKKYPEITSDILAKQINEFKLAKLKRLGVELSHEPDVKVGGLKTLKTWLARRSKLLTSTNYKLPQPKGVMLVGVPGCGKSLVAKNIGAELGVPVMHLDVRGLYDSLLGQTEKNLKRVLKTAESIAPICLWIDEIEKAFDNGNSQHDGGVSKGVLGTFLNWMQEKNQPVFVIATANKVNNLPPEFLRKGRFDEIFFIDLPTAEERLDILAIHIKKFKILLTDEQLKQLVHQTSDFSGAEIAYLVTEAVTLAFSGDRRATFDDLETVLGEMTPQADLDYENLELIRSWARKLARRAS
ncbi:AAA family ATPase [Crocosphaera sp. UHCC 0190]|uniref:AAA family ATPase n=1 Tax=Crocosphaera sp. UHCC 0190 TaxID=3110246 RepID=UPI002B1EE64F|nr:AAA family ATPase [Crocosphaera sp. UHCC 0190]MEA5512249.1 AAA family ATPase [Crocosphaera sp. UHCC 0190]